MGDSKTEAAGPATTAATPSLEQMQHWTRVIGQAQQMMLEHGISAMRPETSVFGAMAGPFGESMRQAEDFWADSMALWRRMLAPESAAGPADRGEHARDRRFKDPRWHENPVFDWIRQSYFLLSDHMLRGVESIEGLPPKQHEQLRFMTRGLIDAMSPANFAVTNPAVLDKTVETGGENLIKGLQNMLTDLSKGQMTQTDAAAFAVGRNLATTPGKVIHRTPMYELIQYEPTTKSVLKTPLVIFPPWINRFYILDLTAEKSFIRWAVDQGITVFMVSWKSADASMKDVIWDDYIGAEIDAIDTIQTALSVESVHAIGYCVAGTTLAAALAILTARGEAGRVKTATYFTAQVDFTNAGELLNFVDDEQIALFKALSPDGYLDGRYMAATFNLLRGRDLIWNYVTNNYLLGQEYTPFDLLHWNSDTTNLPATWHQSYLTDLYRDNLLVRPGALSALGTPIDLRIVATPSYIQAGREDHIAPAQSVWRLNDFLGGSKRFVLAGSGHIAGVVNPPAAKKYQYWTNSGSANSLESFMESATETAGSWWPDWVEWLKAQDGASIRATGARMPGKGKLPAICDAPGQYVLDR